MPWELSCPSPTRSPVDIENAIATVTFNRPAKRNAMSPALHLEMADALEKLRYETTSRVVVITGAGEAFCAGMDLKQFFDELKDNPPEFDRIFRIATEWRSRTLRYYPKPTIAMVNGYCFGGAFSIVEGCDLAFAAEGGDVRAFGDQLQALSRRQRLASHSPTCCARATRCSTR